MMGSRPRAAPTEWRGLPIGARFRETGTRQVDKVAFGAATERKLLAAGTPGSKVSMT